MVYLEALLALRVYFVGLGDCLVYYAWFVFVGYCGFGFGLSYALI